MFAPLLSTILLVTVVIFVYMTVWFIGSLILKRNDIADIAWGLGFIAVVWSLYINNLFAGNKLLIIAILTTLWGLRLATHIYLRNKDKKEDYRYQQMREKWGNSYLIKAYLQVFMLQGLFMLVISASAVVSTVYFSPLSVLSYVGILIWVVGFIFETVGDYQLSKFIADKKNKGKIMTKGFWKYTRHPNYFGEVTQWWGIFLIAISISNPTTLIAIVSPLMITYLILMVSGIPMLEEKYKGNKEFQKYKKETNAFFPWFPKKGSK